MLLRLSGLSGAATLFMDTCYAAQCKKVHQELSACILIFSYAWLLECTMLLSFLSAERL